MTLEVSSSSTNTILLCQDQGEQLIIQMGQSKVKQDKFEGETDLNQITEKDLYKLEDINSTPS